MPDLSLRQLRYFDALSRHRHFGRAAEAVAISQPALSMQIADMEVKLGVALVERTRRGVVLTPDGEEFQRRSRRILDEMRDLVESMQGKALRVRGPLRLGVIPSLAPYAMPRLLPALSAAHPDLKIHLRETLTAALVNELLDGRLDLLLLALPIETAGVETLGLLEDRFFLATAKARGAAGRLLAAEEVLPKQTLLLLEEGHCLRDQSLSYCKLKGDEKLDTFGVSSVATIVQMVANGLGVTLLPEIAAEIEARHSAIDLLRFRAPEPSRQLGLAWRAGSPRRADFAAYGGLIRDALAPKIAFAASPAI